MGAASKMASLLGEKLFEISGQGPAPSKDFYNFVITRNEVKLTVWTISLRRDSIFRAPKQVKSTFANFLQDKRLQEDISNVFGEKILVYSLSLCQGHYDYLDRIPEDLLLRIISFLQLKERFVLAQVSKRFKMLCNSEKFWEMLVKNDCPDYQPNMEDLAKALGWKLAYFTFFHTDGTKTNDINNTDFNSNDTTSSNDAKKQ
ncbi:F-box only protein 36a isoform X1 [Poeciliopsis prolifica]|uniref:F-box only protein 36a isoform X1 n=1 Tax=Poeciliopsis prolifica TaxID=188132 RepID=UPI0024137967|nr:F-box only protein 36a isoform X1 [Poeciliopsis prolifica]